MTATPADPTGAGEPVPAEEPAAALEPAPLRRPAERRRQGGDGLGSLVGGGSSQVGTSGAMRARDVSRPR
ncbi:MAG: hypothetical protein QOF39_3006 [Frankiales bacterium]|nr:hypothetical protein [Frankiales bacterium]